MKYRRALASAAPRGIFFIVAFSSIDNFKKLEKKFEYKLIILIFETKHIFLPSLLILAGPSRFGASSVKIDFPRTSEATPLLFRKRSTAASEKHRMRAPMSSPFRRSAANGLKSPSLLSPFSPFMSPFSFSEGSFVHFQVYSHRFVNLALLSLLNFFSDWHCFS